MMFSKPVSASCSFSLAAKQGHALMLTSFSSSNLNLRTKMKSFKVSASGDADNMVVTSLVFQPFEEVKKEDLEIPVDPQVSLARQKYSEECESAINEQIKWVLEQLTRLKWPSFSIFVISSCLFVFSFWLILQC